MGRPDDILTADRAPWLADATAQDLCTAFADGGAQICFVGGCVRNAVLGHPVSDIDLATSAIPERARALAEDAGFKVIPTGIDHGTITAVRDGQSYEITTFRKDVETDGRRAVVAFSEDMSDDARRRDFTMNALYADAGGRIFDPVCGLPDARAGRVRFIDDPEARIREDYLRILRYFRFFAFYGNHEDGFDPDVLAAIAALADGMAQLSRERIGQEFLKLLSARDPAPALGAMLQCGVLIHVLPGADPRFVGPLQHLEETTDTAPDALRRLAVMGGDDPQPALRLSGAQAKHLGQIHDAQSAMMTDKALGYAYGTDVAWSAVLINGAMVSTPIVPARRSLIEAGANAQFPISAKDLPDDLTGPEIGKTLKSLKARWLASDLKLTKSQLLG